MRMLITSLLALSLSIAGLPGLHSFSHAALAATGASPSGPRHVVQARAKKRRARPAKTKAKKVDKKPKKNDRGFEL
ncbi:MAG TPA: hypothetical protein VKQ32_02545 [Polyangia bacterium]|nr:hypothetical protein [Polyangia bacterium]